jgi:hypothetical protein
MKIREHTELEVYKKAFDGATRIFELTEQFPKQETYSITAGRFSGARCVKETGYLTSVIPACFKRESRRGSELDPRLEHSGVTPLRQISSPMPDSPQLVVGTDQMRRSSRSGYLNDDASDSLYRSYDEILRILVAIINRPQTWVIAR